MKALGSLELLQQHLPFTVLKPSWTVMFSYSSRVATTPTVYGIETHNLRHHKNHAHRVATTPTVYGIETL